MAATMATARGFDRSRVKETHRLGSQYCETTAATWRTFVHATVTANGEWSVTVIRDGKVIHVKDGGAE